jgi:predicted dehydrogenase
MDSSSLRTSTAQLKSFLVEKPVAHDVRQIDAVRSIAHSAVLVGYNRRYYRTTRAAKQFVDAGEPLLAHLVIPEGITLAPRADDRPRFFQFFENSSHAIDLARYIFGGIEIKHIRHLRPRPGVLAGFAATFESQRGDVVQVLGNWGAPSNFALTLDRPGTRLEMRPFEVATTYDGMDVVPASDEHPIRRYVPKMQKQLMLDEIDNREKPGFVAQAREFAALMEGKDPTIGATLADALEVMRICQKIVADS